MVLFAPPVRLALDRLRWLFATGERPRVADLSTSTTTPPEPPTPTAGDHGPGVARRVLGTLKANNQGLLSNDPALAMATDDDWAFEELDAFATTGTDPPRSATPN